MTASSCVNTENVTTRVCRLLWTHLAPEPEVLDFGFEVSNVGDLRSIFPVTNMVNVTYCVSSR